MAHHATAITPPNGYARGYYYGSKKTGAGMLVGEPPAQGLKAAALTSGTGPLASIAPR